MSRSAWEVVGGVGETDELSTGVSQKSASAAVGSGLTKSNGIRGISGSDSPGAASSTASDSPTPTNSLQEANWYTAHWHTSVSEEQAQLLGTEEESSDRQSDGEIDGEVWEITTEQREYYKKQFLSLRPNQDGLLGGHSARAFFEKSRLPVAELRRIWQLADVTKDGALSLDEFNVAMHLVVLRRNHIPLPESLPPALLIQPQQPPHQPQQSQPSSQTSSTTSPHRGKQWTKFVESPTSSLSSPGPKPVNFDFQKASVEADPKILHPVALRATPERPLQAEDELSPVPPDPGLRPIQRPQPKKHTAPGPGAIPPPPPAPTAQEESLVCGKKDPPPPPPPRPPYRHHTRSSSLDLTRLGRTGHPPPPPVVPPRTSPSAVSPRKPHSIVTVSRQTEAPATVDFANFAQFSSSTTEREISGEDDRSQGGAFQIYRKPSKAMPSSEGPELTSRWSPPQIPLHVSLVVREAHNLVLRETCHSLYTNLVQLKEERAALQSVLDNLLSSNSASASVTQIPATAPLSD